MDGSDGRNSQPGALEVGRASGQRGFALLVVLAIFLAVTFSSASFVWFMQQQQTRAGLKYRSTAAMTIAEAGIHRALHALETTTPAGDAAGRFWRPTAYSESMQVGPLDGRFTVSIVDTAEETIVITSTGEVSGVTRRLRAHVRLSAPALLASLNGAGIIRLERPPTATLSFPYATVIRDWPWIHFAAGRGFWLGASDVSINMQSAGIMIGPGPLDAATPEPGPMILGRPAPARLAMPRGAEITLAPGQRRVDPQDLRAMGVQIDGDIVRSDAFVQFPEVDRSFYQTLAADNVSNAQLNEAAGRFTGDDEFARKRDSLYSQREFEQLQTYLAARYLPGRFAGVIYVRGRVALPEGQQMHIVDGALVTEGSVLASAGSSLDITHSAATRTLPGIITLDAGPLVIARGATVRVHGLVYASRIIYVDENAHVDIVGSVLGNDPDLSFRNVSGLVVIRYDPAVLGTRGLRVAIGAPVVAWVSAWEELP